MVEKLRRWARELKAQLLTHLTLRLIPKHVIADCRLKAEAWIADRKGEPANYFVAALVVLIWIALAWWAWTLVS